MTTPAPGWYPDPAGRPQLRWWDGGAWSAAAPAATSPLYGTASPGPVAPPRGSSSGGNPLVAANKNSLITLTASVIYVFIALASHVVFFGILPALYAVRSFQAKERLAPFAALGAVAAVGTALVMLNH